MQQEQHIKEELKKITSLLRDTSFALEMAKNQEAAYYISLGQTVPLFLQDNNNAATIKRSVKDEKIATNIAGFYALECAIGALMEQKGGTPVVWLNKINEKKLDATEILVFNRFANATWKAGQPFRGLSRIRRDVFISGVFLPEDEIKKDFGQVSAAAAKLLPVLQEINDRSREAQLKKISLLLKDKQFAMEMAQYIQSACYTVCQQPVPAFLKPGEDTATIKKSVMEEKTAINIAGFYALECGLGYLVTSKSKLPSAVLQSIINDSIDEEDKRMFERFANAT